MTTQETTGLPEVEAQKQQVNAGTLAAAFSEIKDLLPSDSIEDPFMPLEEHKSGRGRTWNPNNDSARSVKIYKAKEGIIITHLSRNSANKSEGCFAKASEIQSNFGIKLDEFPHRTQVTLVLINRLSLIGYILNSGKKTGVYFPKPFWPEGAPLPASGVCLPVKVAAVIIG